MTELPFTSALPLGEKTSAAAARVLREAILSGELRPHEHLGEQSLARRLGLSRTPIREALLILQADGLIEMAPNRPAVVRGFSAEDLREMHSLRALLEGYAARTAATRLTDGALGELRESCRRYGKLRSEDHNLPKLVAENFTFHQIITTAAASPRLEALIRQTTAVPLIYRSYLTYSATNRETAWRHHLAILEKLEAGDAKGAELAMTTHIEWARDVAIDHLPNVVDEDAAAHASPA